MYYAKKINWCFFDFKSDNKNYTIQILAFKSLTYNTIDVDNMLYTIQLGYFVETYCFQLSKIELNTNIDNEVIF